MGGTGGGRPAGSPALGSEYLDPQQPACMYIRIFVTLDLFLCFCKLVPKCCHSVESDPSLPLGKRVTALKALAFRGCGRVSELGEGGACPPAMQGAEGQCV